ncbi:M48 family metallopeptidase [Marinovum sp. 2_MG-2023]|uniref:M48 family metallopeptidase n=1 Tax=unclassified Marinovum TaxID=2647166 RepID=UPI0026E2F2AD|nr:MULTISPECIES: M48 family metallopeptidase [unclassified Marinovum]MDO6730559.1 M48 family metallopeptidase [Marinovum sp. 2_MG-2023]MDO6778709.1 M48 family metallopeptidase [Marinovum sp. 1_MG-2023]
MIRYVLFISLFLLSACAEITPMPPTAPGDERDTLSDAEIQRFADRAARQFVRVVETVEPVAEAECRNRTRDVSCDFQIVVDDRLNQPPNAFHTLDRNGQPIIAFNLALILAVENADELAFIMGHEAAHHIAGHIERARQNATLGAQVLASAAATISGGDSDAIRAGQQLGAAIGRQSFTKDFELEADALGTIIAYRAGYDPVKGAKFFSRIPDPGNRFLGTHPPNAARIETVRRVAAGLQGS